MLERLALSPVLFACTVFGITAATTSVLPASSFAGRGNGDVLLARADSVRNPSDLFKMKIRIDGEGKQRFLEVASEASDKAVITGESPKFRLEMNEGEVSAFDAQANRFVRQSLSQRVAPAVNNADLVRHRWSDDYSVISKRVIGRETQLVLKAEKKHLPYPKMRLWLDSESARPLRAEYVAEDSKTVLKKAYFENYRELAGGIRPALVRLEEPSGAKGQIAILDMQPHAID